MRLVILGLKNETTGEYKALDPDRKRNKNITLSKSESKVIPLLAPFPFKTFTSLTFDSYHGSPTDGWTPCYLEVEAELSDEEYQGMRSGGIVYYRFPQRKVTLIQEFLQPFKYSLEKLEEFKEKLGSYNLLTWVIHYGAGSPGEKEAMLKIIDSGLKDKKNSKHSTDFSITNNTLEYLPYLLTKTIEGYNITFGVYGRNTFTQDEFNKIVFTEAQALTLYKKLLGPNGRPILSHPSFDYNFYCKNIKNTRFEKEFLSSLYTKDLKVLYDRGFPLEELFQAYFVYVRKNYEENWKYEEGFVSIEEHFADKDYVPRTDTYSVFDYYCCEDCDGYNIYDEYTNGIPEDTISLVDERIETLVDLIDYWIPYLTEESKDLFKFIPKEMHPDFIDSGMNPAIFN